MAIESDMSEVHRLVVDLSRAASRLPREADDVLKKGAQNIKDEMVADAKGSTHFRQVAPTISYDKVSGFRGTTYDVGPNPARGGAASLAGAYFGWNRGGGTLDIDGPMRNEEPNLLRELDKLGKDIL